MQHARLLFLCAAAFLGLASASCGTSDYGDQPTDAVIPPVAGKGNRIHEIAEPGGKKEGVVGGDDVTVTGAVVVAVDTYDETSNGKSKGAIYVSDIGSKLPYSGISLYQPSFVPGDLQIGPGDALDLKGAYQKNNTIPLQFAPNTFLVQISTPVATFRFDAAIPDPVDIDIRDLSDYDKGRKWLNMLVRLKDVVLADDAFPSKGRLSVTLPGDSNPARKCEDPFPKQPALVNELTDLTPIQPQLVKGATVKSLVGVVTFFCNLHIAPRSLADVQF